MPKIINKKDLWFCAAQIQPNIYLVMAPVIDFFFDCWPKYELGNKIKKYFTYFKGDYSEMWYSRREFDAQAEFLANKMIKDPFWAINIVDKVENYSKNFFRTAKKFKILPFAKMTNEKMVSEWKKVLHWHFLSHAIGSSVSWHADADKERVTKFIMAMVKKQMRLRNFQESLSSVFAVLTTPRRPGFNQLEELEFLKIKNKKDLVKHWRRWEWLPYCYKGPGYDLKYFSDRYKELKKCGKSCDILLLELRGKILHVRHEQKRLLNRLKFNRYQLALINLAQKMVFIKDFRKGALYHGFYCYEPFLKEVAKRLKMNLNQIRAMGDKEIAKYLLVNKGPDKRELNARNHELVVFYDGKKSLLFSGEKANKFFKSIPKEQQPVSVEVRELQGTCASPGSAKGKVKIVEVPKDMNKMEVGDILVSETTYPSLVPAMKKAAAIVTNAGGLTCHAAIVSRELGIPCVVGTKIANKVLKDGDMVEVNANEGKVVKL